MKNQHLKELAQFRLSNIHGMDKLVADRDRRIAELESWVRGVEEAMISATDHAAAAERERDIALSSFCNERLRGDNLDRESQRLSDQLGTCDRERREWIKRAEKTEAEIARRDAAARDPFGYMRVVSGLSFQIMEGAARPPDRSGDSVGPWFPIWTTTPQSASVPDGWKLVPIKPTEDMVISGFESKPDEHFSEPGEWDAFEAMSGCKQAAHKARLCYAAMLAAAPAPGGKA